MNLVQLPNDVIYKILDYLPGFHLGRFSSTCITFYQLIHDDLLWKEKVWSELTRKPTFVKGENYYTYYKRIYIGPKRTLDALSQYLPNRRFFTCNRDHQMQIHDLPRLSMSYSDYVFDETLCYDEIARWLNKRKEFLRIAAESGLEIWGQRIIQQILARCGELNFSNNKLSSPFYIAILNRQLHFVHMLLQYPWPDKLNPWIENQENSCNYTLTNGLIKCGYHGLQLLRDYFMLINLPAVQKAALIGDRVRLEHCIQGNTNRLNNPFPFTALFMAILGKNVDCIRLLIRYNCKPAIRKIKGIQWPVNELILTMITNNLTCFQIILEESCGTVSMACIRQSIAFALQHGHTEFIDYLLNRQYQGIIQEEIYLLSRRIISHKNVKIAHLLRFAGSLSKALILKLVPLLPYCCQSQSSYTDFSNYNDAVSMITILQDDNLTIEQVAQQTPFYQLMQFCKAIINYSDRLDGYSYSILLNVVVKTRSFITLSNSKLQQKYDHVCAEYIRLIISWGADGMIYRRNRLGQTMHELIMQSQKECWINTLPSDNLLDTI
ncbi:uncharacterized protein TRIADDRAFT_57662 [Trichoplax adhaerens]|uniref:F-box domain-containing protein n=1 Tax=Trichoplax adhaerens TaxID=10228 RepID=B3S027_TRIAD|nr:predicted protein [Trichoplax adhaerens]EDV23934.1 predicted protein [Trichoplax adhaerens]|eukprot:XP_002113460.1 predicted protein [Trichoplax adhaerens]